MYCQNSYIENRQKKRLFLAKLTLAFGRLSGSKSRFLDFFKIVLVLGKYNLFSLCFWTLNAHLKVYLWFQRLWITKTERLLVNLYAQFWQLLWLKSNFLENFETNYFRVVWKTFGCFFENRKVTFGRVLCPKWGQMTLKIKFFVQILTLFESSFWHRYILLSLLPFNLLKNKHEHFPYNLHL